MKLRIGFVVIVLATASAALAQSRDPAATSAAPSRSQSALPEAGSATVSQSTVKAKARAEQDEAEARITAQLNRQELANVTGSVASARSRPVPQTATRPSDCATDQPSCSSDLRTPQ